MLKSKEEGSEFEPSSRLGDSSLLAEGALASTSSCPGRSSASSFRCLSMWTGVGFRQLSPGGSNVQPERRSHGPSMNLPESSAPSPPWTRSQRCAERRSEFPRGLAGLWAGGEPRGPGRKKARAGFTEGLKAGVLTPRPSFRRLPATNMGRGII